MEYRRGFGTLRDVRVIGFYNALDVRTERNCVVYVIEVAHVPMEGMASPVTFLAYRRYSQIAILASKLHFHPSVGLPPKYALQPFPLTEEQLCHRYEGLRHFVEEVFLELRQMHLSGKHHDVTSTAGLDMQTYCDFVSANKNRPLPAATPPLPAWATPTEIDPVARPSSAVALDMIVRSNPSKSSGGTWPDIESYDSEDFSDATEPPAVDVANAFRNDVLQTEGQCIALCNCVQSYLHAAQAWAQAAAAVEQELRRVAELPLLGAAAPALPSPPNRADSVRSLERDVRERVLQPLQTVCRQVLPDIKDTFWSQSNARVAHPVKRIFTERAHLTEVLLETVRQCSWGLAAAEAAWLDAQQAVIPPPVLATACDDAPVAAPLATPVASPVAVQDASPSRVYVWGRIPDTSSLQQHLILRPTAQEVLPGQAIAAVASGGERLLYLTVSGDIYSFGPDDEKRGQGFFAPHLMEQFALDKALNGSRIVAVACGAQHAAAISQLGEVVPLLYTWGSGEDGRLGHGDIRDRAIPRKVMSLLSQRVVGASCGGAHTAVVTAGQGLYTFGRGKNGRLGLGPDVAFKMTPEAVPVAADWTTVCCGWNFTVALTQAGRVYCWGKQGEGQCGLGYVNQDQSAPVLLEALAPYEIVQVASGYTHTLALSVNGDVFSWGLGEYGQLGKGSPVPEVVDTSHCIGPPDAVTSVYCGAFHSIATTAQNVMLAWGLNMYGACGLGHVQNRDTPERLDCFDPSLALRVACGHKFTVAVQLPRELAAADEAASGGTDIVFGPPPAPVSGIVKEEELRRSKKLWRNRILRHWNETKDSALAHSLWRQGIPPSIRSTVWPLAIGNGLKVTPAMYDIYRQRAIKARAGAMPPTEGREHTVLLIHTDLPRTFPSLKLFDTSGPYFEFLREVLETYACYRPDLGYIQGMSYIAALLCLHIPTDRYLTFQCLANIMVHEHLFTFYLLNADLSHVYYACYDDCLRATMPELHGHLGSLGIEPAMYLMNWLQTLFLQVLPLEVASRVFDCFLLDGVAFLFRTALGMASLLAPVLLQSELEDALPLLQRHHQYHAHWAATLTEERLFDAIATIVLPARATATLDQAVQNVYFYQPHLPAEASLFPTTLTRCVKSHSVGAKPL
ncbi:regulator of chromosome condensation (RCC1)-like protein [Achlya hypogyna]|uniref:Regulator of chromosome condensation (RCC1)-like protein n=1 Tax=Achlya hypogyna TaxID=1202772 RepID=A0A1V9YCL6_ACHHY|nr:regulator of chromosome condensation (RCC1)-like protein [Achlya hypogyna]